MLKNNKSFYAWILFFSISWMGQAQVTFTEDIAEIIYNNCSVCHRPGEIGPFPMTNYEETASRASMIKLVTESRYMPPWKADPDFNHLLGETHLSDEEIEKIASWVDDGTPMGPPEKEPPFPDFPDGSLLGEPDLVLEFSEAHLHRGNNQDEYRYFVIPTGLNEDKILKAIELRPGNTKIVHHALFFEDLSGQARIADANTPEYGFDAFNNNSGFGIEQVLINNQYPGYVPGQKPRFYPDGTGQILRKGADLVVQMHYAPWPVDEYDRSTINLFFADENENVDRFVEDHIMLPLPGVLINGPFFLQPNQVKTFHGIWELQSDLSLIGIAPHMHLLGKDWEVYIRDNEGNQINLISIPDWDFNWQGTYYFTRFIVAKKGWKIHAKATYDNSAENPFNPSIPPRFVTWGEGTKDEMYYLPILYTAYESGDEDIVFDSTYLDENPVIIEMDQLVSLHNSLVSTDNPLLSLVFDVYRGKQLSINVFDLGGRLVRSIRQNEFFEKDRHTLIIDTENLPSGTYILNIRGKDLNLSEKFVKIE